MNFIDMNRLAYVDIAKALALLFVIVGHTSWGGKFGFLGFCVPAFYFLSGYTYKKKEREVKLKAKRLLLPYILFNAILLTVYCSIKENININYGVGLLYSRYCLYPLGTNDNIQFLNLYNAPTWFLTSLFLSFLLFRILINTSKRKIPLIILYMSLSFVLNKIPMLLPWSLDTAFCTSIFIFGGYIWKRIEENQGTRFLLLLSIPLYILIYCINGNINLSVREYGFSIILCILSGLLGTIVLLHLSKLIEEKSHNINRVLACIGRHSLVIFALQLPLMDFASKTIHHLIYGSGFLQGLIVVISQIVAAILGGYILSRLLHRLLPSIV